jgi:hypothetical protein
VPLDATFSLWFFRPSGKLDEAESVEGSGGTILYKGAQDLLTKERKMDTWTALAIALTDSGKLQFRACLGGGMGWYEVDGKTKVPADKWVHLAVTVGREKTVLYVNGVADGEKAMESGLLTLGTPKNVAVTIESPHPYPDNMDQ